MKNTDPYKSKRLCPLSPTGFCKYGGSKYFNYGFYQGTDYYCGLEKRLLGHLKKCPLNNKTIVNGKKI